MLLVASLISFALFIWIENKVPFPMVALSLLRDRFFSANLITAFITFIASSGTVLLMTFYLQNVLHYDPQSAGMLLAVFPLTTGVIAPISGSLSDRFGSRRLTVVGLMMLLSGYLITSTLNDRTSALSYIMCFFPLGLGMGFFQSPNNSAIMGSAPRSRLGIASGLLSLTRTIGQTSGISIMGAIWAGQVFRMIGRVEDATTAPPTVQVAALHVTMLVIVSLITLGLILSLWAYWQESKSSGGIKPGIIP
jgi:MFS family permease